jgi:DNA repair protein RecO (recombination protein O)
MSSYNTLAVVIRRVNYSETDKILTLYSRDRGRITAIAKGARKAVSRLSGATELLTCTNFQLAAGKSMDIVTQTDVHEAFSHLRQDLTRLAHGLYLADLIDHAIEDHEPNPHLFDLLMAGLYLVQSCPSVEVAARWFELQFLQDMGYQPNLFHCVACRIPVLTEDASDVAEYGLSAALGGVLCEDHAQAGFVDDHSTLTAPAVRLLQTLEGFSPDNGHLVAAVEIPDRRSVDLAGLALRRYLRYRIERDLKSLAFLDSLRQGG